MWNWNCCVLVVFWVQGLVERRLGGGAVWSRDEEEGTTRPPPTLEMDGNRAAVHGTWCHVSGLFEDATTDIEACSSSSASSLTRVLLPAKKLQAARRKLIKEWWQQRQACILVHCSALHPTGHPVGAFLPGRSLSPSQPTHLPLVGVLLIRVFFLGFCDGWQQQDGCHTKTNSRFLQKITLCGSNANHNWLLTLSTLVEMEKLNLWVSINRNRKSTSTVYTYMHDLDTSTPQRTRNAVLFSIASWRTLFRYALFFLCWVQFQCCFNTASNCKKVCTTESSFVPVEFGFWEGGGWCWAHYCNLSWSWQMMVMWHYTTGRVGRGKHGGSRALTVGRSLARSSQSAIHSSFRQVVWIHHKACYHGGGFFS